MHTPFRKLQTGLDANEEGCCSHGMGARAYQVIVVLATSSEGLGSTAAVIGRPSHSYLVEIN